jgi:hypothetical protein
MRKFKSKLTRFEGKILSCCGHEETMREAIQVRQELEVMVQEEVDRWIHSWEMANRAHNECLRSKGLLKDLV